MKFAYSLPKFVNIFSYFSLFFHHIELGLLFYVLATYFYLHVFIFLLYIHI